MLKIYKYVCINNVRIRNIWYVNAWRVCLIYLETIKINLIIGVFCKHMLVNETKYMMYLWINTKFQLFIRKLLNTVKQNQRQSSAETASDNITEYTFTNFGVSYGVWLTPFSHRFHCREHLYRTGHSRLMSHLHIFGVKLSFNRPEKRTSHTQTHDTHTLAHVLTHFSRTNVQFRMVARRDTTNTHFHQTSWEPLCWQDKTIIYTVAFTSYRLTNTMSNITMLNTQKMLQWRNVDCVLERSPVY